MMTVYDWNSFSKPKKAQTLLKSTPPKKKAPPAPIKKAPAKKAKGRMW